MGFYSRIIFPRLCELALGTAAVSRLRKELLAGVSGEVLEIGLGSGLNLPHYPAKVKRITGIDRNPGMNLLAQRRMKKAPAPVDYRALSAERLPFLNESFDSAVSAWTLCSIADTEKALLEIVRILRPGGKFFFLEHGLSEEPSVRKWQRRLTPLNKKVADGCHLDRDIESMIKASGLEIEEMKKFYMERAPKAYGYLYRGTAIKRR